MSYKVSLIYHNVSGSNTVALYKQIPLEFRDIFDVFIRFFPLKYGWGHRRWDFWLLKEGPEDIFRIYESDFLLGTHGTWRARDGQVSIEMWHGFPLKGMVAMDYGEKKEDRNLLLSRWADEVDIMLSYSRTYSSLMAACMHKEAESFIITGMPRNDFLFDGNAFAKLQLVFPDMPVEKPIIFYMPTFRLGREDKVEGDVDRGLDFDRLEDFLDRNDLILVVKFHPFEEEIVSKMYDFSSYEHIFVLRDEQLVGSNMDFYEILGAASLLITDYSSVYFDYLLLDRPIVFYPPDINIYIRRRGFLLEPYDIWAPGPKAYTQDELESTIVRILENPSWYKRERQFIRDIVHHYQDDKSSYRVWKLLEIIGKKGFQYIKERSTRRASVIFDDEGKLLI